MGLPKDYGRKNEIKNWITERAFRDHYGWRQRRTLLAREPGKDT
jgi:hypothetical protein